jgi:hypothetical protein
VEKDLHQCRVLEELTRSQSASPLWIEARFCPITASNAKDYARKMKWDKFLLDNHGQAFNKRKCKQGRYAFIELTVLANFSKLYIL